MCDGRLDMWSTYLVLFFKQKTAYEMRISDWSSDVCSSDLPAKLAHTAVCTKDAACVLFIATELPFDEVTDLAHMDADRDARVSLAEFQDRFYDFDAMDRNHDQVLSRDEIGRAACRERVCQYV